MKARNKEADTGSDWREGAGRTDGRTVDDERTALAAINYFSAQFFFDSQVKVTSPDLFLIRSCQVQIGTLSAIKAEQRRKIAKSQE